MIDQDVKQRVKVVGIFLLQSYKIITGTMLSIFIPQSCGYEMCTLTENYNNTDTYHQILFYWNSLSMLSFLFSYLIELRREEWCVKYLDIDNNYPDNSLKEIIIKENVLDNYMDSINKKYYYMIRITSTIYFINICLSLYMINNKYYNSSTLSCFVSFSLLVMMKLYNSLNISHESVKNDKMMSAYMNEFVSFNVLDQDYINEKYNGLKNNRLEDISDIEQTKEDICHGDSTISNQSNESVHDDKGGRAIEIEEIIPIVNKK